MAVIADTGALLALANAEDRYHPAVKDFFANNRETVIVPCPVVPETCFMLRTSIGLHAELHFLRSLDAELLLEHQTAGDISRAIEINEKYREAEFGMVDATVMAMAERMKVEVILTVDYRDFEIYRPVHCTAFRLVPEKLPSRSRKTQRATGSG